MEWRIRLFGPLAQARQRSVVTIQLDEAALTIGELKARLAAAEPALASQLPVCRFAVNHAYAGDGQRVTPEDEVALIGMVSGG